MLPSVRERKKNRNIFNLCYNDICKAKNLVPLGSVRAHLLNNSLDFVGDRVKLAEWYPILNALSLDRSLHFIAIRCMQKNSILESVDTEIKAKAVVKRPVLFTKYVALKLMTSVKECLCATKVLTCIELEGLPLTPRYVEELCKGIAACDSLQNVSLHRSLIGDAGVELVCRTVKYLNRILSLDFSACGVGEKGALAVVDLIRYQKLVMCSEQWEQTLRNRVPETKSFPGLRRITLNHNPKISDQGALQLVEVIADNVWIKAVDLQNCGLTDSAAGVVLAMLQTNTALAIVDVRSNQISPTFLKRIMLQLGKNNAKAPHDYHWLSIDHRFVPAKQPSRVKTARVSKPVAKVVKRPTTAQSQLQTCVPHYALPLDGPRIRKDTAGTRLIEIHQMESPPYNNLLPTPSPPPPTSTPTQINLEKNKELVRKLNKQLQEAEETNKSLARQVEMEVEKRRQAEAQVTTMQSRLEEKISGSVLLNQETVEDIQDTFTSFATFLKIVRASGFGSQNRKENSSPDVFMTDDDLKERMKLVLSRSAHEPGRFERKPRIDRKSQSASRMHSGEDRLGSRRAMPEDGAGDSPRVTIAQTRRTKVKRRHHRPRDEAEGEAMTSTSSDAPDGGSGRSRNKYGNTPMGEIKVMDAPQPREELDSELTCVSAASQSMFSGTEITSDEDTF